MIRPSVHLHVTVQQWMLGWLRFTQTTHTVTCIELAASFIQRNIQTQI